MKREIFYNEIIKKVITAFGSIFDNTKIITSNGDEIEIPVAYLPREKFLSLFLEYGHPDTINSHILPRIGFELTSINFSPERYNNPLEKMRFETNNNFIYSRIPFDFSFTVYIGTVLFEDSLKIIEQIVPFFTPELNISIRDHKELNNITDIPVVLNSVGFSIDYLGDFTEKRKIQWELQFTAKAWLYSNIQKKKQIEKAIIDFTDENFNTLFTRLIEE